LNAYKAGRDGAGLEDGVTFDAAGNLYGTISLGGGRSLCQDGCGTIFELSPN